MGAPTPVDTGWQFGHGFRWRTELFFWKSALNPSASEDHAAASIQRVVQRSDLWRERGLWPERQAPLPSQGNHLHRPTRCEQPSRRAAPTAEARVRLGLCRSALALVLLVSKATGTAGLAPPPAPAVATRVESLVKLGSRKRCWNKALVGSNPATEYGTRCSPPATVLSSVASGSLGESTKKSFGSVRGIRPGSHSG